MYNLLLVDDEPLIKVAFQSAVEWGKNGFLLAATASNGQEALHIVETQHIDVKSGEVEIGTTPPGWIVVAAADSRSPLLLPEQAKMCESSLFTRGFTHFGSFRKKRMAPEPNLRCLYVFLFHFAPLIL